VAPQIWLSGHFDQLFKNSTRLYLYVCRLRCA